MKIGCFLDTNVLIYAAGARLDDPKKFAAANELIARGDFCLSAQVLAEFYVNAVKKYAVALSAEEVDEWMDTLSEFPVAPIDAALVRRAIALSRRFQISYWDAALVAAAERFDAPVLYTEDLSDGQTYGSVTAMNPFKTP